MPATSGEINDSQQAAWHKTIEVFDAGENPGSVNCGRAMQSVIFPEDRVLEAFRSVMRSWPATPSTTRPRAQCSPRSRSATARPSARVSWTGAFSPKPCCSRACDSEGELYGLAKSDAPLGKECGRQQRRLEKYPLDCPKLPRRHLRFHLVRRSEIDLKVGIET